MSEEINKETGTSGGSAQPSGELRMTSRTVFGLVVLFALLVFGVGSSISRAFRNRDGEQGIGEVLREAADSIQKSFGLTDTLVFGETADSLSVNQQ